MAEEALTPVRHPVYRSVNKPLNIMGVDRRLFFFGVACGAGVFNLFNSPIAGGVVFAALYAFASWATKTDPQILAILLKPMMNPAKYRPLMDPGKLTPAKIHLDRTK